MLSQQVKRERRPPRGDRFPPRQPPARSSQWQAKPARSKQGAVPNSNWVSRAGAAAARFPRPEGADISQQNSAFAAVRQGRRISREHQSLVTVRTVFTPAQSAHFLEARTLRRRNAAPHWHHLIVGERARKPRTQAAAPSARSLFQSARWFTPRCGGKVGKASPPHWNPPFRVYGLALKCLQGGRYKT